MSGGREVLIEVTQIGGAARVAAIDVASGVEIVFQAPAHTARADLEALAVRKLERALAGPQAPAAQRPGKLV